MKKFACQVIMNIHIKEMEPYDEKILKKIIALIREYDCEKYVYFMTSDAIQRQLARLAPDICRCCSAGGDSQRIVERAIELGCRKLQFVTWRPFTQEMVDKAHANGIRCNLCQADKPEDAERYLAMGIDTIMTNDYQRISTAVRNYKKA